MRPGRFAAIRRLLTAPGVLSTLLPMLVVSVVGGLVSWQYHEGLRREHDLVAHTWEVIATTGEMLTAVADAETGQRGYIITGDAAFLAPYQKALIRLPRLADRVRMLVADNPTQQALLDGLQDLIDRKLIEMDAAVVQRRRSGFDAARILVAGSEGKEIMDQARGVIAEIVQTERVLLAQRSASVRLRERWVVAVGLAATLLSIATRGLVDAWSRRRARRQRMQTG